MGNGLSWSTLQHVVDAMPLLFFHKDTENRMLHVNKAVADSLDVAPADMEDTLVDQWYPNEADTYYEADRQVIQTGKPQLAIIEQLPVESGEKHWIRTDKFPEFDDAGDVTGILVFVRDLTAESQISESIQSNDETLGEILTNVPDLVVILDEDGRCTEVSGEQHVLGTQGRDLLHAKVSEILPSELSAKLLAVKGRILENGGREEFDYTLDVDSTPCDYRALLVRFDRDDRVGVLMAIMNQTNVNLRDAELFRTQRRLELIVESEPECVKVVSASGMLLDMNPAGLRMIEADSMGQVKGLSILDLITPEHREAFLELHLDVVAGGSGVLEFEIEGLKGTRRWVETHAAPLRDSPGSQPKHLAITRDISDAKNAEVERKALEAQVRHAQKLESIGVLAGGIAHDFNNHLLAILGNASVALDMVQEDDRAFESIQACVKSCKQAADVCDQLLTYAGKRLVEAQPTDLTELVRRSAKLMELSISKRANLQLQLAEDLPAANIDVGQIRQLVINLVTNASEALVDGVGRIRVRTGFTADDSRPGAEQHHADDGYVYVEVSDNGVGMAPEVIEKMFDPFFTTKFTGRGLGLATVVGTARGHDGFIETDSSPGLGTRIRAHFPATTQAATNPTVKKQGYGGKAMSGTVLVVDDVPAVREMLQQLLGREGFEVILADGGEAGVEAFEHRRDEISAVILDHTMPGLSGHEVCARLRAVRPDIPVLLSSGHPEDVVGRADSTTGPAAFLKKPYTRAELLSKLAELVDGPPLESAEQDATRQSVSDVDGVPTL